MDLKKMSLELHRKNKGKITVQSKVEVKDQKDLSLAYSPGVAEPCLEIEKDPEKSYEYTAKGNLVAVVSNGTAVLGLGDIGALGAMPVMEGKCVLFKEFAGVDAFPLCIDAKDVDGVVNFTKQLEPTFAGINLEDIAAPECFEIERRLKEETNMAIFHDDQHGTAIVTLAGLINALKIVNKKIEEVKVVINGAGASAIATLKLLQKAGVKKAIICDSKGAISKSRIESLNPFKAELCSTTNQENYEGDIGGALVGADVFIGLSKGNLVTREMVSQMAADAILFPMANPIPEIMPEDAKAAGAKVIGTGRSDFPNQINNVLAFPGVLKGALTVRSKDINDEMKIAAAEAIANLVGSDLSAEFVVPSPFDQRVAKAVAKAVAQTAITTDVARIKMTDQELNALLG